MTKNTEISQIHVGGQVWNQVSSSVQKQPRNRIWNQLKYVVWNIIGTHVWEQIKELHDDQI